MTPLVSIGILVKNGFESKRIWVDNSKLKKIIFGKN